MRRQQQRRALRRQRLAIVSSQRPQQPPAPLHSRQQQREYSSPVRPLRRPQAQPQQRRELPLRQQSSRPVPRQVLVQSAFRLLRQALRARRPLVLRLTLSRMAVHRLVQCLISQQSLERLLTAARVLGLLALLSAALVSNGLRKAMLRLRGAVTQMRARPGPTNLLRSQRGANIPLQRRAGSPNRQL